MKILSEIILFFRQKKLDETEEQIARFEAKLKHWEGSVLTTGGTPAWLMKDLASYKAELASLNIVRSKIQGKLNSFPPTR